MNLIIFVSKKVARQHQYNTNYTRFYIHSFNHRTPDDRQILCFLSLEHYASKHFMKLLIFFITYKKGGRKSNFHYPPHMFPELSIKKKLKFDDTWIKFCSQFISNWTEGYVSCYYQLASVVLRLYTFFPRFHLFQNHSGPIELNTD